jgi:hypothetical protein
MRSLTILAALLVLASFSSIASAQAPLRPGITSGFRPTTSPYLNLNRAGVPPAINYYQLVRPELAFRSSIQGLQADVDTNRQLITTGREGGTGTGGLATGHSATFLNTGGYFLSSTGGLSGRATTPAPGAGAGRVGTPAPKGKR